MEDGCEVVDLGKQSGHDPEDTAYYGRDALMLEPVVTR